MEPTQLGPYRIGRRLGRGGMGTVYEGTDADNRKAAVKVLSTGLAHQAGFRERFEAEIESLKKLRHPNIVRLFGYGEEQGALFYAMELVEGTSLEDELQNGRRFDWREVVRLAVKLCRALKHAHDHGVIHRDIKPANLLLTRDDEIKLSDFGIAKLFGSTGMTMEGGVLGTAEFMAPEQADGRPVTNRCDFYSTGCVLYTLLAGRPPFRATSLLEMLQMQRYAQPEPVRRFNTAVPAELEEILGELLRKDPQERLANPMLLARRLEAMEHALSVRETRMGAEKPDSDDFDVNASRGPTGAVSLRSGLVGETMSAPEIPVGTGKVFSGSASPAAKSADEDLRATAVHVSQAASDDYAIAPQAPPASHFTEVKEKDLAHTLVPVVDRAPWMQIAGLVAALFAVVVAAWWFLSAPSANKLFDRIASHAERGTPEALADVEEQIDQFLERFPNDDRAAQVREHREELDLDRMGKRLTRGRQSADITPEERALAEALHYAELEPELGILRLRDLLALYPVTATDSDDRLRRCLLLARRRLDKLEQQVHEYSGKEIEWLKARLDDADKAATINPVQARAMFAAIVDRYRNKSWAADLRRRAAAAIVAIDAAEKQAAP